MNFKLKEKQKGRNQDINVNDMAKYFNVIFAEAKLMASPVEGQNQVALYLFNSIKLEK